MSKAISRNEVKKQTKHKEIRRETGRQTRKTLGETCIQIIYYMPIN